MNGRTSLENLESFPNDEFRYDPQGAREFPLPAASLTDRQQIADGQSKGLNIPVVKIADIVTARQCGRELAAECGFSSTDSTVIATVISELARNIVLYAREGEVVLSEFANNGRHGIKIISRDQGPGIADVERALMGGYSTSGGLGLGLYGVRRMSDEFRVETDAGKGTVVTVEKWLQ